MGRDDKEIGAMRQLYEILNPLDRGALERIIAYVCQRIAYERAAQEQAAYSAQQNIGTESAEKALIPQPPTLGLPTW